MKPGCDEPTAGGRGFGIVRREGTSQVREILANFPSSTIGSSSSRKPSNQLRDPNGFGSSGSQPVDAITGVCREHVAALNVQDIRREQWRQSEAPPVFLDTD